jgi:DNA-directed RNA polymerase subunit omega
MIDALKEEGFVKNVGGRFRLSTLIQTRLVALNAGSRPLVEVNTDDKMEIVIEEILRDKIYLDASANVQVAAAEETGGPPELDLTNL